MRLGTGMLLNSKNVMQIGVNLSTTWVESLLDGISLFNCRLVVPDKKKNHKCWPHVSFWLLFKFNGQKTRSELKRGAELQGN